jgi:hypothetical protein
LKIVDDGLTGPTAANRYCHALDVHRCPPTCDFIGYQRHGCAKRNNKQVHDQSSKHEATTRGDTFPVGKCGIG